MRLTHLWIALTALAACSAAEDTDAGAGDDSGVETADTDTVADTDTAADTDAAGETDETAPPAEVGFVRYAGYRYVYLSEYITSITVRIDGAPITATFDEGLKNADGGWFYPGAEQAVALAAGTHSVTLTAAASYPTSPGRPNQEVNFNRSFDIVIPPDVESYINIFVGDLSSTTEVPLYVWTTEDTRTRSGSLGARWISGPETNVSFGPYETSFLIATDGCVARYPSVVSDFRNTTKLVSTSADDTADSYVSVT